MATESIIVDPWKHGGSFLNIAHRCGLMSNLQLCLDAGEKASYSGSGQSFLDIAGGGYDFFRGADGTATTDDPTFNGTAGGLSSGEYWSFDGGDYFRYDTSNETWMANYHKDNATLSIACWVYHSSDGAVRHVPLFSTFNGVNTGVGLDLYTITTQKLQLLVGNGSGTGYALSKVSDAVLSNSAWHFLGLSLDEAGNGFFYADGGYLQVGAADTWTAAYTSPSAAGATNTLEIGALAPASVFAANGDRFAGGLYWSTALTKASFDNLWAASRGRFGV